MMRSDDNNHNMKGLNFIQNVLLPHCEMHNFIVFFIQHIYIPTAADLIRYCIECLPEKCISISA